EYRPRKGLSFDKFDGFMSDCYEHGQPAIEKLVPSTLEGCVVRVCDMIAYLGKDRQDAIKAKLISSDEMFTPGTIGSINAEIINNLEVDIIENSYGRDCIVLSPPAYEDLRRAKEENYKYIYKDPKVNSEYEKTIEPMMGMMYRRLLDDVRSGSEGTEIYRHHIKYVNDNRVHYDKQDAYINESPDDIVVDYIASMTDDYFIALFRRMFPDSALKIHFISYFEEKDR
ncbi:MAG: phosphohydrolase, partial [Oscillospiraceae bacterium]|nr:phosphohydrolase [Oscillospiraceae bacterium]